MRIRINVARNNLPRFANAFEDEVADAINHGINSGIEAGDPRTPVDTGNLVGNKVIQYASAGNLEGEIHWAAEYALYQNSGTGRGVPASGFADEAAEVGGRAMAERARSIS